MTEQEEKALEGLKSHIDEKIAQAETRIKAGLPTDEITKELKALVPKVEEVEKAATKSVSLDEFNKLKAEFDVLNKKAAEGILSGSEQRSFREVTEELIKEKHAAILNTQLDRSRVTLPDISLKDAGPILTTTNVTGDLQRQYRQQIVMPPARKLHIRELLPQGPLNSAIYTYPVMADKEGDFGIQTEGATKSTWDTNLIMKDSKPVVIAALIHVSNQMLADVPYLSNYVQNRGIEKLYRKEDDELLRGPGGTNRLSGIFTQASLYTPGFGTQAAKALVNRWDVLVDAMSQIEGKDFAPTGILVHPSDYAEMVLSKTTYGEYTYPGFAAGTIPVTVAGIPVYKSTAATKGSFLIGDFTETEMLTRDVVNVVFSYENKDNIEKNMTTIRIEERIAFNVYQPNAFLAGSFGQAAS